MKRAQAIGATGAFLAMSAVVVQSSAAAFTATTANVGNTWAAGTVAIRDGDLGNALFTASALTPGNGGTRCIVVTYDGSVAANVKLYSAITGGTGLGQYLDLTVQRGTGLADCSDFASTENVYTGTVAGLAANHSTFGTGRGTWAPTGADQRATYRFSWTLQDDNAAQGKDVHATFTWEAQNS